MNKINSPVFFNSHKFGARNNELCFSLEIWGKNLCQIMSEIKMSKIIYNIISILHFAMSPGKWLK